MTARARQLLFASTLALLLVPGTARAAGDCPTSDEISIREAPACIGQFRRVVAKVDNVGKGKSGVTFINFCKDFRKCPFVAVVFAKRASAFPDPATLVGETVEISGQIQSYQSQSQVVLEDASQLVVRGSEAVRPPRERPAGRPEATREPAERRPDPDAPTVRDVPSTRDAEEARPKPRSRVWPDEGPAVTVETVPAGSQEPLRGDSTIVAPRTPPRADPKPEPVRPEPSRPAIARGEPSPSDPKPVLASAPTSIAAQDAVKYVGKRVRVKGKVTQVTFEGNDLVARMSKGGGSVLFAAVVPGDKVEALAGAVEGWDGQVVELEGEIVLYAGVPAVFVRSESQVTKP